MPNYKCYRCNYTCDIKSHIYNHFVKKNKCFENINSIKYTNDQIIKYSLCKNKDNYEKFVNKTSKYNVSKTTSEFIEELKITYKNKIKTCKFCNQTFQKYADLEYHLFECIEIIDDNNTNNNINNTINNNEQNNVNANNIYNNCNVNNVNNVNNYNININYNNKLISFDDEWSTEHLTFEQKMGLFLSHYKITKTLESILENDINRNVFLNDNNKTCIIYKGDEKNQFDTIKSDEIFKKSINKLYKHLRDFEDEIKETNYKKYVLPDKWINESSKMLEHKINDYKNNNNTKESVNNLISDIFNKHKDDIKDKYIDISNDDNKISGF